VSREFLTRYWSAVGFDAESADIAASVASCHHGTVIGSSAFGADDDDKWEEARSDAMSIVAEAFGSSLGPDDGFGLERGDPGALVTLAGMISVADWLASNAELFDLVPTVPEDLGQYVGKRSQTAREAVKRLHLAPLPARPSCAPETAASIIGLPKCATLNPLQRAAIDAADAASGPCLIIIEAPTGEGKTEAALLAHRALTKARPAGLFYGLPTQATSSAIYSRVNAYLRRDSDYRAVESHLLFASSFLNDEYAALRVSLTSPKEPDSGIVATDWFCGPKRGLLAAYSVGTIDQAIMAALKRRHFFVRLYGLSGKVVVLDEIHAYDRYMRELIKTLLAWLRALGCPVILLSATLGRQWREELAEAYLGSSRPVDVPYPSIVRLEPGKAPAVIAASLDTRRSRKTARFWLRHADQASTTEAIAAEAAALSTERCVVCVCNTVGRAQDVYAALKVLDPGCAVSLLHSRYTRADRTAAEDTLKARFGPDVSRPHRAVVVATQVLEQSLDLDFDVLITEIAPLDLLLQRLGRVMRHVRGRPDEDKPTAVVFAPEAMGARCFGDSGYVYEPIVLARTLDFLRKGGSEFRIPDDVQAAIDEVYDFDMDDGAESAASYIDEWRNGAEGKAAASLFQALNASLPRPTRVEGDWSAFEYMDTGIDDEAIVGTRLGRLGVDIAVLDEEPEYEKSVSYQRRALDATVRISNDALAFHLFKRLDTSVWKDIGPLRRVVPLRFRNGAWSDGAWTLEYDREIGLRFSKGGKPYEA